MPDILVLSPEKNGDGRNGKKRKSLTGNKLTRLKCLGRCKYQVKEK